MLGIINSSFQGSLPLLMMFDLPDEVIIDDSTVQNLQESLHGIRQ
jgi:hypothetical protein